MSLARGLDYYTGVIYEAILLGNRKFDYLLKATVNLDICKVCFSLCRPYKRANGERRGDWGWERGRRWALRRSCWDV